MHYELFGNFGVFRYPVRTALLSNHVVHGGSVNHQCSPSERGGQTLWKTPKCAVNVASRAGVQVGPKGLQPPDPPLRRHNAVVVLQIQ
jgi:hypothetical protein